MPTGARIGTRHAILSTYDEQDESETMTMSEQDVHFAPLPNGTFTVWVRGIPKGICQVTAQCWRYGSFDHRIAFGTDTRSDLIDRIVTVYSEPDLVKR